MARLLNSSIRFFLLHFVLLCAWSGFVFAQSERPLRIGIMPFNSTMALLKTHHPLIQHLERQLDRKVVFQTSTDYFTFINQLLDGQFDIAIAGPHFGIMARERGVATIVVRYKADLQPVFVVRADGHLKSVDDLHGKRIGLSSLLSISSIGGVKWLDDHGFKFGRDYTLAEFPTHGAAIAAVAVGDVDAALTTYTPLKQVPDDISRKIRVMPVDIRVPHLMTLVSNQLGTRDLERIRSALRSFPLTAEGAEFFRESGYLGYAEVSSLDTQALKPFVELTLQMMRIRQ